MPFPFLSTLFTSATEITLFDYDLISPQVQAALPTGYQLRPLRSNDYERGFLKVLEVLTEVGHHTKEDWLDFTITITDDTTDKVVAAGTLLIERKFVHKNGVVGHIEDIAVDANQQGKKLGLRIIEALKYIGASKGCYKVILDCAEKNIPFYEKCGFQTKEHQMAWYVPNQKANL
ncbi:Glucosamine-phosphate N-acetyltransferase-like protein [Apophysomyces sp. BC1034]|nr:Glucosamine-phosphate N-acetyltransferase-like protein [Apophysomyces sp. BC1015]KAG0182251.1 Glucosamine-phosphate N-acetyltransferase-like protein [Apophysomyces sp. BC1021]KAG0191392.1 Glucosamine-phosphate N-acetyltransferase-like protein [Apophysomyces sp. BC1034]